ncbi:Hsp20/alpha crystallin family protein [Streptomyces sp. XY332]|uniref:Hsp20/alpha crystallin family protein n=1 Tax=Streptomyces sp. XY332 TaxID=1415561 RepID=UPI003B63A336
MARWSWTSSSASRTSSWLCHGRGTRRSNRFGYQAMLPSGLKPEDATAALVDGVLTITVPSVQSATARGGKWPP